MPQVVNGKRVIRRASDPAHVVTHVQMAPLPPSYSEISVVIENRYNKLTSLWTARSSIAQSR